MRRTEAQGKQAVHPDGDPPRVMADVIAPRIDRSARDVAEKILFAREDDREPGKVIFLIGAGCSISAGVPGAVEIGRRMTREVARRLGRGRPEDDAETAYRALVRDEFLSPAEGPAGGIDWYRVYDEMVRRPPATASNPSTASRARRVARSSWSCTARRTLTCCATGRRM
jgi:hypothetical protein